MEGPAGPAEPGKLSAGATNELTDQLCFLNDLLGLGLADLSEKLAGLLWEAREPFPCLIDLLLTILCAPCFRTFSSN